MVLDIGIGLGDTMIAMAEAQPELDVIGVDVHTPGVATSLSRIDEIGLTNVRVVHGDALEFVDRLPAGSLTGVRIYFPDPWPKIRQRHRRLVRDDVVAHLVELRAARRLVAPRDRYRRLRRRRCNASATRSPSLRGGVIDRPAWRPVTRYERRGLDLGHTVVDLWYDATSARSSGC